MNIETSLKRFLKRRTRITLGFVTAFLITGSVALATEADPLFPKEKDTEILFFLNGGFGNQELASVKNMGEFKLIPGGEMIKPPIEWTPIEPSEPVEPEKPETIPGIDIIKPGEEGGPITKPVEPEKPQGNINTENKVQENGIVFDIKEKETFVNEGTITYKSDIKLTSPDEDFSFGKPTKEAFVIKNNGGNVINKGTIKVEGMNDCNLAGSGTIIKTGEGIGVYQTSGTFENKGTITVAGNGYDYDNNGGIDFTGGTAVLIEGGVATNNGTITSRDSIILPDGKYLLGRGIGMKALNGTIINGKEGTIEKQEYGMMAVGKGNAINDGTITTENFGILAFNGGTATNNGTINAWKYTDTEEARIGLYASAVDGTETTIINGKDGKVYGNILAEGGNSKIINDGYIYGKDITAEAGGTVVNNGSIAGKDTKPVVNSTNGKFIQSVNGKLDVSTFNGDLYLSGDYTKNNFEDKITVDTDNISIEKHNGQIKSDSVMFTYNSSDKTLERKEFSELLSNKNIASYLENNYHSGVNDDLRVDLTNNLKDINTVKEFNRATNNLFGNDIYPAINKQTFEMIRFNRDTLYSQVFNKDTNKETRFIGGADYKTFDVDSSNLSGYNTDIQSVFIGMDKQITNNNRLGGILNIGRMKSSFDMNNAEREDIFFQGNLYNIYQKDDWKLVNNLFFGITDGNIDRDLKVQKIETRQSADIDTSYVGVNNVLSKKYDLNSFYVTPKLELNLTQVMNSEIQEDGDYGLEIEKQDVMSVEAGVGIEVGKDFMLTDTLKAGIKLSGTYLAELSDPYEEINVRLRQINHSEYVKISEYDNEDYKDISLRLELSNDSISSYAEYKYMFDDSIGTLGVSYKF